MKILLLCNKSPWPPREGGPIAMFAILDGLAKAGHSITVLAANTNKYFIDPGSIPEELSRKIRFEFAYIDLKIKPWDALVSYLSGLSYHAARFRNKEFTQKLIQILKNESFDIIQCETLFPAINLDTIRKFSNAPVILRAHNIEHLIWKRLAENTRNPIKKHYLNHLYLTLKAFELEILEKVDGIAAITGVDADFFRKFSGRIPVISVPFGIDIEGTNSHVKPSNQPDLFHIGSMNWIPNQEGIDWFLETVWPEVQVKYPTLKLYLAGRMMPQKLVNLNIPGVIVEGEVENAQNFMNSHHIMIVPLFSGSGIRIKIIEAMMAGKAIISTSTGSEGINVESGKHLLIANDKDAFIDMLSLLLNNNNMLETLGSNARKLIISEHNNKSLTEKLTGFYQSLIAKSKN